MASGGVVPTTSTAPARPYSWPPFERGHTLSMRHGVWSKRTWEPIAEELVTGLLDDKPDLAAYPEVLAAWARAEARCILLSEYLVGHLTDGGERSEKVLRFVAQFEKLAHDLRRELGLTPGSEADLARSRADAVRGEFDLQALMARGRQARLAAEERQALSAAQDGAGDADGATEGEQHHDTRSETHGAIGDADVVVESTGTGAGHSPAPVDDHSA